METHSSIFAWKIPWTEESGGLQTMELQSQTQLSTHMHNDNNSHYWKELSCHVSWADLGTGTESGKWSDEAQV